jgi:hypothetical protein
MPPCNTAMPSGKSKLAQFQLAGWQNIHSNKNIHSRMPCAQTRQQPCSVSTVHHGNGSTEASWQYSSHLAAALCRGYSSRSQTVTAVQTTSSISMLLFE